MTGIKLEVTSDELDLIMQLLTKSAIPWEVSNPLIVRIMNQANNMEFQGKMPKPENRPVQEEVPDASPGLTD